MKARTREEAMDILVEGMKQGPVEALEALAKSGYLEVRPFRTDNLRVSAWFVNGRVVLSVQRPDDGFWELVAPITDSLKFAEIADALLERVKLNG